MKNNNEFKTLSFKQKQRLQDVISAAVRLGVRDPKIRINGKVYALHMISGNLTEASAPDYIKKNIVNVGK